MTSSSRSLLPTVLILLISAAVGWLVTGNSQPASDYSHRSSPGPSRSRSSSDPIDHLRSQPSESDRLRSTLALALSIPSSELNDWLTRGKFSLREGYSFHLFQQIILDRLSREDPAAFLAWIREHGGGNFHNQLSALCENHPELIQLAFSNARDMNEKGRLLHLVTHADPNQALAQLKKIIPLKKNSIYLQFALNALAKKRPNELEALLDESDSYQNYHLVAAVYEYKLAQDFDQAFEELCALPNGFYALFPSHHNRKLFEPEQLLARLSDIPKNWLNEFARNPYVLVKALGTYTPALEIEWERYGFSQEQVHNIRYALFRKQASQNPVEVFQQLHQHEFADISKFYIFNSALTSDPSPETLAELTQILSNPEDQALFQKRIEDRQKPIDPPATPDEILTSLERNKLVNLSQHLNRLKPEQREDLASRFPTLDVSQKNQLATLVANEHNKVPLDLQQQAIEHLLHSDSHQLSGWTNEDNSKAIEKSSRHALDLMSTDSTKAARWVDSLPDSPTRLQTKVNLAGNWKNLDPSAAQTWIDSQPPEEKAAIIEGLRKF